MKNLSILALVSIITLSGCTTSSGVVPLGKDTYMVSGTGKGPSGYTGAEVKVAAIKEASEFCRARNKHMQIVRTQQNDQSFGVLASAEVHFMCLDHNDPELARPKLRKEPDQVIEIIKEGEQNSSSRSGIYVDLLQLDDLRKRGLITEQEFQERKQNLLKSTR